MHDRESYMLYKARHICVSCRQRNAVEGKSCCEECLQRKAKRRAEVRASETPEQKSARLYKEKMHKRAKREKYMREGVCVRCGNTRCAESKVFCYECRVKLQKNNKNHKEV